MEIEQHILGFAQEKAVVVYEMRNASGAMVRLINIGAAIVSIDVPDNEGKMRDVALGYKMFDTYLSESAAMGKSVGRYANRIAKGQFTLNGKEYTLAKNNGVNHLHGGPTGFQSRIWDARVETNRVVFSYVSAPGEEGYPGELGCEALYDWSDDNQLEITYFAASNDSDTIVNLTNHIYFNLNGEDSGSVLGHTLKLNAECYLPADETQIPTGELAKVEGTPMDFRAPKELGLDINADDKQIKIGSGFDHCFAIDGYSKGKLSAAAELYSPLSGICLNVYTTQPGIQVYTGNFLDGSGESKSGRMYKNRDGVALECQNFPNSPNVAHFPSPILRKDEVYEEHVIYKFSVK